MPELSAAQIRKVVIEEATRAAERGALATSAAIQRLMPVKTGQARRSMTPTRPQVTGSTIRVSIGSNVMHVRYLNDGTGIYGPENRRITPKARAALSFVASSSKGKGKPYTLAGRLRNPVGKAGDASAAMEGLVTVASVKGIEPMRFVERGYQQARDQRIAELRAAGPRIAERLGLALS